MLEGAREMGRERENMERMEEEIGEVKSAYKQSRDTK